MMKKRTIAVWLAVLAVCLTVAAMALSVDAAETLYYGTCGDGVIWTLDTEGNLVISGTGAIDFGDVFEIYGEESVIVESWIGSPWNHLPSGKVVTVEIKEGVTSIPYRAFNGLADLERVEMADSVTSIGVEAFYSNDALTEVVFSKGLRTIGYTAFRYCTSLAEVYLHDGLTTIEGDAFSSCYSLQSVRIPASVTEIGTDAFRMCSQLELVTVESSAVVRGATEQESVGDLFCHPKRILTNQSAASLGAWIKANYKANGTENRNGKTYTRYDYQPDWDRVEYDSVSHFISCNAEGCGAILLWEQHVYDNPCAETCNVCGYFTEKSHSETVAEVSGGHQTVCQNCGLAMSSVAPHVWGDECWGEECYACSATREAPGHQPGKWQYNDWEHWRCCDRCEWELEKGSHSLPEGADLSVENPCAVCGMMLDTYFEHFHTFGSHFEYNEEYHWQVCTGCQASAGEIPHYWGEGILTLAPTTSREGERTYVCDDCDAIKTETIDRLPPESENGGETVEPPVITSWLIVDEQSPDDGTDGSGGGGMTADLDGGKWDTAMLIGGGVLLLGVAVVVILAVKKKKK